MTEAEKTFNEFWRGIVENPDGTLNRDQVMRELHDYWVLLEEVPKVYDDITGGRFSKPNTAAHHVIAEVAERTEETCRDLAREISSEILAAAPIENGVRCPCHEDAARIAREVAGLPDDTAEEIAPSDNQAIVTIRGCSDYHDGTYRSGEIDIERGDPDNPYLRIWLDAEDEQADGSYRIAPHAPGLPAATTKEG